MESGVEFNFSYAPGIDDEQIIGVELAGQMWSNYLGDTQQSIHEHGVTELHNTVINIHVEIGSELLPENVIGGSFPAISDEYKYEEIYDALTNDITTANDSLAVDSLTNTRKTDVLVNGNLVRTEKMQLTTANLKALNLIEPNSEDSENLDGYILMNDLSDYDSLKWNYDYLGGAKEGTLDFLTTVTHEIGHALGFINGTDRIASVKETLDAYQNIADVNIVEQGLSISKNKKYTDVLNDVIAPNNNGESTQSNLVKFDPEYGNKGKERKKFNEVQEKFDWAIEQLQGDSSLLDGKTAKKALEAIEKYLKYDEDWDNFIKEDDIFQETKNNLDPKKLAEKMTSLDLFRHSDESSSLGASELTRGSSSYFSLDGSETALAMSNGLDYQGSHWQDRAENEGLGIMNPTVALNERLEISSNDLMAMDAIGWDVDYAQPLDMQALYDKAADTVDSALITNRQDDVDKILDGDAYEGRRTRTVRTYYRMSADGYFSTFSESDETVTQNVHNKVLVDKDLVFLNKNAEQDEANNIVQAPKISRLFNSTKSIDNVAANYLEIDRPADESDFIKEIRESLKTGLEIETQTL